MMLFKASEMNDVGGLRSLSVVSSGLHEIVGRRRTPRQRQVRQWRRRRNIWIPASRKSSTVRSLEKVRSQGGPRMPRSTAEIFNVQARGVPRCVLTEVLGLQRTVAPSRGVETGCRCVTVTETEKFVLRARVPGLVLYAFQSPMSVTEKLDRPQGFGDKLRSDTERPPYARDFSLGPLKTKRETVSSVFLGLRPASLFCERNVA